MPTGYTQKVGQQDGYSFEEFTWACARVIGYLSSMRDEPADAPIPEKFEPLPYRKTQVAESEKKVAKLEAMTPTAIELAADADHKEDMDVWADQHQEQDQAMARYKAMEQRVRAWQPPTPNHQGLKEFMLQQLEVTISEAIPDEAPERREPQDWYRNQLEWETYSLKMDRQRLDEEIKHTAERNEWLAQLRQSVPLPVKETTSEGPQGMEIGIE